MAQFYYPYYFEPIVTAYLEEIEQQDLIKTYGLAGFDVQCINPRKTICDKISRLVKLSYNENANELLAKHIRYVYNLSSLFYNPKYKEYLLSDEFLAAMYKVTLEDGLNKNSRSHLSLVDAPVFKEAKATIEKPGILTAYTTDLKRMLSSPSYV